MADLTAGRARPGAMAFVLLTVALSWLIWITVWLATGRPAATPTSAGMVIAIYAGSFAPGIAAAIVSGLSPPGSLKEWARGFVRARCGWRAYAAALLPIPLSLLLLTFVLGYEPRLEGLDGRPSILLYLTIFPVSIFNGLATAIMGAGPLRKKAAGAATCCLACGPADSNDRDQPFQHDGDQHSTMIAISGGHRVVVGMGVIGRCGGQAWRVGFARRILSPSSSMRWALWTRRSRMASA